ncbi:MAG TPA: pyridoxamine 5'-phosphate oxidase family protein [Anaerohalosphaeraceae bacterium]|nr:pyridoxamine 5'-phosphate oxidase family protein [Anaerohalosphaeraceae bacterium]
MDLKQYFETKEGWGVLATCNAQGQVDTALYAKPYIADEQTAAFVMKERLSHQNLQSNLHASYLFMENAPGYRGVRLSLTMRREESNQSLVEALRKKQPIMFPAEDDSAKFVVFFRIDRVRPLVGDYPLPE